MVSLWAGLLLDGLGQSEAPEANQVAERRVRGRGTARARYCPGRPERSCVCAPWEPAGRRGGGCSCSSGARAPLPGPLPRPLGRSDKPRTNYRVKPKSRRK
nr:uncharacterized protein LOC129138441 isoform X2 [Pan troglodytes]